MYASDFAQVGRNIQNIIAAKGITQQKLADELSISKQVMDKIVKGQKALNVSELSRIAAILGTAADALLSVSAANAIAAKDWLNPMGQFKDKEVFDKVQLVCSAIDEIHLLEELG